MEQICPECKATARTTEELSGGETIVLTFNGASYGTFCPDCNKLFPVVPSDVTEFQKNVMTDRLTYAINNDMCLEDYLKWEDTIDLYEECPYWFAGRLFSILGYVPHDLAEIMYSGDDYRVAIDLALWEKDFDVADL